MNISQVRYTNCSAFRIILVENKKTPVETLIIETDTTVSENGMHILQKVNSTITKLAVIYIAESEK